MDNQGGKKLCCCLRKGLTDDLHAADGSIVYRLGCGHLLCDKCLMNLLENDSYFSKNLINCAICTEICEISGENMALDDLIISDWDNNNPLFERLIGLFKFKIENSKEFIDNIYDYIDLNTRYAKDELEIRIESIKYDLEKLYDNYVNELNELNRRLKEEYKRIYDDIYANLDDLLVNIDDNVDFVGYKNKLNELIKEINDLNEENDKQIATIRFRIGCKSVDETFIGNIDCLFNDCVNNELILKRIRNGTYTTKKFDCKYDDYCYIESINSVIFTSFNYSRLDLYDANEFCLKKTIDCLDRHHQQRTTIKPTCVCVDDINYHIYFTDARYNRIFKINYKYETQICMIDGDLQFPNGIDIDIEQTIYVCDTFNKCVKLFDKDLCLKLTHKLAYTPRCIKIIKKKNRACIIPFDNLYSLYVYNLSTFELLHKIENFNGVFGVLNNHIYEYNTLTHKINCYNLINNCLIEQLTHNYYEPDELPSNNSIKICYLNGKLSIYSNKLKELLLI